MVFVESSPWKGVIKIDRLLPTILGAIIGAFSAAAFSYVYQEHKTNQILRILSRLLLDEVVKHSIWLDRDQLCNENRIKKFSEEINIELWDEVKFKLQGISFSKFELVRQHFKNMKEFKITVKNYPSGESMYPLPDELFLSYKSECDSALAVLGSICYQRNSSIAHWIKTGINPIKKLTKKLMKKSAHGDDSMPFK
ncbi:MAG: hypothetical protein K0R78_2285 [Pelosinus sp.]|jgi:hypothetical protein|nr:hypothetical protein [Pelosinus sp.]